MATIHTDLIKDSRTEIQYNQQGLLIYAQIDRSYFVNGITDYSPTDARIHEQAISAVQAIVPVSSPHPIYTVALSSGYRVQPWEASDGAEVIVRYSYNAVAGGTGYVKETDCGLKSELTGYEYDESNNKIPIEVKYNQDWLVRANPPSVVRPLLYLPCNVTAVRPVATVNYTKGVSSTVGNNLVAAIKSYVGFVNSTTFDGNEAYSVLCTNINVQYTQFAGYVARLSFGIRPELWKERAIVTNTQFGKPTNIWPESTVGADDANGFALVRPYPSADMNTLFSIFNA